MAVKTRRAEYSEQTRTALVASARTLFVERGYNETSIEDIVSGARVTRGAFYHHFDSKQAVFEQVFADVHGEMTARIGAAVASAGPDLWVASIAGLDAFLDMCLERDYQRITLHEGPLACGWQRYRELDEKQAFGLVRGMVASLMKAGLVPQGDVDICARILFASFAEAAMTISTASDQSAARDHARTFLMRVMDGLRA